MSYRPSYIELYERGELKGRIEELTSLMESCRLCPRRCEVNRLSGELGVCRAPAKLTISSAFPHFGEEAPLVGFFGSGTVFLTYCNLLCCFCQNYDISHLGRGTEISVDDLALCMIELQRMGCHNINFVTPTHFAPLIVAALPGAIERGLELPIVWNCGGYESLEVLMLLEGIVDIYMPDAKYSSRDWALKFSKAPDYPQVVKQALLEMHRQVGDLEIDGRGIAKAGLLVRHLLMPNDVAGTRDIVEFIAAEISKDTYINIMAQYRPCHEAYDYKELNRRISRAEYLEAVQVAHAAGLWRGFPSD